MRTPSRVQSTDDSERTRTEHSVELTLPPKKSSKHYNRRAAKNHIASSTSTSMPLTTTTPNGNSMRSGDSASDKENFCDRDKLMGESIAGDGPYQQMRLPDGQMVLMLQPHYLQLAAALGINAHDGMNHGMMDFETLIELSRKQSPRNIVSS